MNYSKANRTDPEVILFLLKEAVVKIKNKRQAGIIIN